MKRGIYVLLLALLGHLAEAGVRDHTRPAYVQETQVSESQAQVLSLTLADVTSHQIQSWVRTAGQIDDSGKTLVATHCFADAALIKVGQRVIAFRADSKSSISQGRVSQVNVNQKCSRIEVVLAAGSHEPGRFYVMEIVVPRGRFLAIPKEAIIEEKGRTLVYIKTHTGHYRPRVVYLGLKGERYTQILHGLKAGEYVVTLGSFFIHAQYQLNERQMNESSHAHHAH